jgi:CRISPR-associated protein Csm4
MPNLVPFDLTFPAGFRVGTRGVNLEESAITLPSDTLFAALIDCARRMGDDATQLANAFVGNAPPFLLGCGFPRAGQVRFYPVPPTLFDGLSMNERAAHGKGLKRIQFFSQGVLDALLKGAHPTALLFAAEKTSAPTKGVALQGGALWLLADELPQLPAYMRLPRPKATDALYAMRLRKVWAEEVRPRVTVSRSTAHSDIFHAGRVLFAEGCGLWFGVQDLGGLAQLHRLLLRLCEDGLGGERSAGYGAFSFSQGQPIHTLPDAVVNQPALLLSRYHPTATELPAALQPPAAAYTLVPVGGWVRSLQGAAQRRPRVVLVREGSVIAPTKLRMGDLADVTPRFDNPQGDLPHRVYRYGLALMLRWKP